MTFRIGLAQCSHPADGDAVALVDAWATRAKNEGVDLLVFPESLMTPFELSDDDFAQAAEPLDGPFCTAVDSIAARYGLWMIYTANEAQGACQAHASESAPAAEAEDDMGAELDQRPFNTAVIVDDTGTQRAVYRKTHLFDTDFVQESSKVKPGSSLMAPITTPFATIGLGICYDVRFPELSRAAALAGAELLVYPAAWVDGVGKADQWRTLLKARAIENQVFVVGLSRCDRDFGSKRRNYAGHSCIFDPLGNEVVSAGLDELLLVADLDLEDIASARAAMPCLAHRRDDLY